MRISYVHMCKIEGGQVTPSFELALRFAEWFGVPVGNLWELSGDGIRAISR